MPAHGLICIATVRAGREAELRAVLNRFGNDVRGARTPAAPATPRIDFLRSRSIHFARLALLDAPESGPGRKRLLFATDYDGAFDAHVREVFALTRQPEAIWGCCEGYGGPDTFAQFIRRHMVQPQTYYIAFRGQTLGRLRRSIELREWFNQWLADPRAEQVFLAWPDARRIGETLLRFGRAVAWPFQGMFRVGATLAELVRLARRFGAAEVFQAAMQINRTLDRVWWIRPFNRLFANAPWPPAHRYSQAAPGQTALPVPPGHPPEDAVFQNQLTLVTEILPAGLAGLRAVLALIDLYGRRLSSPGSLVGISTIHTVRWAIIDDGRRLLMVSNYDGAWENYIDEFAEMILSGLDALWASAPDYPAAGAQDLAALKQFLRSHQAPANVFYSAYPTATVLNLNQDLAFARWFGGLARRLAGGQSPATPSVPAPT